MSRVQVVDQYVALNSTNYCFSSNPTAGDLVLCCESGDPTGTPSMITNAGDTFVLFSSGTSTNATNNTQGRCWYIQSIIGGSNCFQIVRNGQNDTGFTCAEYSGQANPVFELGVSTPGSSPGQSSPASYNFTTSNTDLIFFYYADHATAKVVTAGTNFNLIQHNDSEFEGTEEWIGASPQTTKASINLSGPSPTFTFLGGAFKAQGAAATTSNAPLYGTEF